MFNQIFRHAYLPAKKVKFSIFVHRAIPSNLKHQYDPPAWYSSWFTIGRGNSLDNQTRVSDWICTARCTVSLYAAGRVRRGEARWGEARWSEVRWGEVRWGGERWGEVRWGEVRWGEVRWGEVRWGEARRGGLARRGEVRRGAAPLRAHEARARHRPCEGKSISRANWFDCVCLLVRVRNVFRVVAQALPRIYICIYALSYTRVYRAATHTTCRCNEAFVRLMHREALALRAAIHTCVSRYTAKRTFLASTIAHCTNAHMRIYSHSRIYDRTWNLRDVRYTAWCLMRHSILLHKRIIHVQRIWLSSILSMISASHLINLGNF